MRKILLPVDLHKDSSHILKKIISTLGEMAGPFKIIILGTYMVPVSSSAQLMETHDKLRAQSLESLKKKIPSDQELERVGKITFEAVSQIGSPINVISRLVEEEGIDCVIVESRKDQGKTKQDEVTRLLERLHCPVFVLPSSLSSE